MRFRKDVVSLNYTEHGVFINSRFFYLTVSFNETLIHYNEKNYGGKMDQELFEKKGLVHNGEYIHDFLLDLAMNYLNIPEEFRAEEVKEIGEFITKYPDELNNELEVKSDYHNYFIEDVNYGIARGGMACGPVSGPIIVSVRFKDGEESKYLSCCEFEGFPYFYLTEKDIFNYLMGKEDEKEQMTNFIENEFLRNFEDIKLGEPEYYDIYKSIRESKDYNAAKMIRYVLNLVNLDFDATAALVKRSKGKHISEFFVSRTRTEIWYDRE